MPIDDARSSVTRLAQDAIRQAQSSAGRELEWQAAIQRLKPLAEGVVGPLRDAGLSDIYVEGYRNALVVRIGSRPYAVHHTGSGYSTDVAEGAELLVIMENGGSIRALQRPFYPEGNRPVYQTVGEFAHPADVTENHIGDLIVRFLDWVVRGEGRGGLPLRLF
jgi:hypothetical protein